MRIADLRKEMEAAAAARDFIQAHADELAAAMADATDRQDFAAVARHAEELLRVEASLRPAPC
eukprot:gene7928-8013_t